MVDAGPDRIVSRGIRRLRRFEAAFKITLKKDRRGDTVNGAFSFFSADVGGNQQLLRRPGGHPLVPSDDRNG